MRELTLDEMKNVSGGMDYSVAIPPNFTDFSQSIGAGAAVGAYFGGPVGALEGAVGGAAGYVGINVYQNASYYYNNYRNNDKSEFHNSTFNSFVW